MSDVANGQPDLRPVCEYCGSSQITRNADVAWDVENQTWGVNSLHCEYYCEECDGETTIRFIEIRGRM